VALRDPVWQLGPPRRKFSSLIQQRFRFRFWWSYDCGSSTLPDRTTDSHRSGSRSVARACPRCSWASECTRWSVSWLLVRQLCARALVASFFRARAAA